MAKEAKGATGRVIGIIGLALLIAGVGGPVLAQENPSAEPVGAEEEAIIPQVAVGEIIVTAQKREVDIQEVPLAVSTLSGEDLQAITSGAPDVRALSARVPSLILESSFGRAFPRFYIRGLGNTDFDLNASQPVSMIIDEVVMENPVVKGMPIWDMDRVEVLRGPQGTLFGRNTPAGIVKFESKKPTQEFEADFRASYGTYDTIDINGAVGGPLSDTVSLRFSGLYQSRSDWIDNGHTGVNDELGGYDTTGYRLQLLWEPTENFDALFNIHGWDVDGTARIFRANIITPGDDELVPGFEQDMVYLDGLNSQEISAFGGVMKLDYDFGGATLTSVTGFETLDMYSRGDIDGGWGAAFLGEGNYGPGFIPFPSESACGIPDLDQFTQEFRLTSNGSGPLRWLTGLFYFNEEVMIDNFSYDTLAPGNPQNGHAVQWQETEAYALFGSVSYEVNEKWDLAAGLRFSHDEKDFWVDRPQPIFQPPLVAPITEQTDEDYTSWDLSVTYKASPNVNWYGRVATSFRAPSIQGRIMFCGDFEGGTNPATNCVTTADTEEILSTEIGVKSILADNRLRLNLTAYIFEVDGQQLTAVGGQYNTATLLNADKTEGHGFEADIEYIPTGNWLMTFGLSYNPTKIKDRDLTVAPCGGGCTVTDPLNESGLALINGNPLPHAPEWIVNGIINFRSDPEEKGLFGVLDWAYYSEKNFFLYESEEFQSDSLEIGLRLGYAWNNARYEVALFGRNILDEEIVRNGIDFNNLTGMMNEPRIIGVEFVGRF
ncbi:MAG: TonB-dependent receptor [Thermoanaerobaculales bacterium]|nr:TonB-dependent receptor [Thermoanaerobaculales bacterium]